MKTLRDLVENEMEQQSESEEDIERMLIGPIESIRKEGPETRYVDSIEELEDFEGHSGFGAQELPTIYVWTEDRVYLKRNYDGAETMESVPRHPTDNEPPESVGSG